jgi:flagellar motor switch protein FliG
MSSVQNLTNLTGTKKAALLLLSLSKEEAAKVLSHLDDKMIEQVVMEMSQIRVVSKIQRDAILEEFKNTLTEIREGSKGGLDTARELLSKTLGSSKTEEILKKLDKKDIAQDFEFLNEVEPSVTHSLLSSESPQTVAVTLSYLQPKKAAEVLKLFPSDLQTSIAIKLASTSKTHPDAVLQIARILKKKYDERDRSELAQAGGAESLANILNFMDKSLEENILKNLDSASPDLAYQVRDKLYVFEDLLNLDQREMRTLVNKLGGNEQMVLALRGAGDEMKRHFFSAMSQNRAGDIVEEMDSRGKVTLREINQARNEILKIARELEEEGVILLKKKKEEFI